MSDEKKIVAGSCKILTEENCPEWAEKLEGVQMLLDGILFQHSINRHKAQSMNEQLMKPLSNDDFKGVSEQTKAFEVLCGVISAYFSAMALALPHEHFRKYISPLADVLGYAWENVGLVKPMTEEETEKMIAYLESRKGELDDMVKQTKEKIEKSLVSNDDNEEVDNDTALSRAVEKLRGVGKGLLS